MICSQVEHVLLLFSKCRIYRKVYVNMIHTISLIRKLLRQTSTNLDVQETVDIQIFQLAFHL